MKTTPITPARSGIGADDTQAHALNRARRIFLAGNQLPARWQGRHRFVVLETGFGLGHNFLATWDAWQRDSQRCQHLHYLAIEKHPPLLAHLQQAHQQGALPLLAAELIKAWPPLTPNLHTVAFADGRVRLLLALGDVAQQLPALHAAVDAYFLTGSAAADAPEVWPTRVLKALGRKAAPGATLATWTVARAVHEGLTTAGFQIHPPDSAGGTGGMTSAVHRPRPSAAAGAQARAASEQTTTPAASITVITTAPLSAPSIAPSTRTAVVVGAGLAGAAAAQALAQQGLQVTVLESGAEPAGQASGNVVGLFHGTVNADDGTHARLHRAAALWAARTYAAAFAAGVPGQQAGLLRLDLRPGGVVSMQAQALRQGWPADYVQPLSAAAASGLAGVRLPAPAWLYPGGGWISPPLWVRYALTTPGVQLLLKRAVAALHHDGRQWQALNAGGQVLAQADVMVLANTQSADALLQRLGHAAWPLVHTRGQITLLPEKTPGIALQLPLTGDGYTVRLPAGLWCGASSTAGAPQADELPAITDEDHQHNLQRLQRLVGSAAPGAGSDLQGRAAWRLNTNDRLPIAGAVPLLEWPAGQRQDQARLLPREPGLFVLTALGARGLTLAHLLAQLVAAQATGAPWPLEQDLADAVDPARWRVRAARSGRAA